MSDLDSPGPTIREEVDIDVQSGRTAGARTVRRKVEIYVDCPSHGAFLVADQHLAHALADEHSQCRSLLDDHQ